MAGSRVESQNLKRNSQLSAGCQETFHKQQEGNTSEHFVNTNTNELIIKYA